MKRTDQERIERELKRREKHAKVQATRAPGAPAIAGTPEAPVEGISIGDYIRRLVGLLQYDDHQIYNTRDDEDVFELLLNMKVDLPEKQWEVVLKSAIQKTKVEQKEQALTELKELLAD